jgi:hypothetical protein
VTPNHSFLPESQREIDETRVSFRKINRKLREASLEVTADFWDEA